MYEYSLVYIQERQRLLELEFHECQQSSKASWLFEGHLLTVTLFLGCALLVAAVT